MIKTSQMFPYKIRNAVVVDIGSSKICALSGALSKDGLSIEVSSYSLIFSKGINKGVVRDLKQFSETVSQVIVSLEQKTNSKIKNVFVSVGGSFIEGCECRGLLPLGDRPKQISAAHVKNVVGYARSVYVGVDKNIMHAIVSDYIVDNQSGIRNPIGLYGRKLEAKVHFITAKKSAVYNLINGFNAAGIEVEGFISCVYASGMSVLSQEEREQGCAVIDIGAGLCELGIFRNGLLKVVRVLEINANKDEADKNSYYQYIENIFRSFAGHIDEFNYSEGVIKKVVITGGGALDDRVFDIAQQSLPFSSEVGVARGFNIDSELLANPSFACSLGMLRYVFNRMHKKEFISEAPVKNGFFQKILAWVKEVYEEYF